MLSMKSNLDEKKAKLPIFNLKFWNFTKNDYHGNEYVFFLHISSIILFA